MTDDRPIRAQRPGEGGDGSPADARHPRRRRRNAMRVSPWIFVGVGLGGLLVVVALVTLGRGRQPEADREALADAALQTIEAHAAEHPEDLDGLITRYEALRSQHPDTQAAQVAAERIRQLQDAQREIAKPPPPPPPPPKPDLEAPALAALRAIEAYAATHRDDLDDLIARYQALRSQHPGTQAAEVAAERIRQLDEARQEAAKPPAQPDREAEARAFAALRAIETHAAESPDDLDDLIARYDALGQQHPNTDAAKVAAERSRQLQDVKRRIARLPVPPRHGSERKDYEAALRTARPHLDALLGEQRYGDAVRIADAVARKGGTRAAQASMGKLKQSLLSGAKRRYETMAREADDAAMLGEYARAREAVAPSLDFGLPDIVEKARKKLAEIDEAARRAEAGGPAADALRAYGKHSERLWQLLHEHKYGEAAELAGRLSELAGGDVPGPVVQADEQAVALMQAFWPAVEKGLKRAIGVRLAIGPGAVKAVRDGHVTFEDKGEETTCRIDQLDGTLGIRLARLGDSIPGILTRVVVHLAERKELHRVEALLDKAGAHPTVPAYRRRLAALRQAERTRRK